MSRPEHLRGMRHLDPARIVQTTLDDINTMCSGLFTFQEEMAKVGAETFRARLPLLRENQAALARFVAFAEAQAKGMHSFCGECGSRFYPSRSDARYCGGACRTRSHRRGSVERAPDVHQPEASAQ